MFCHIHCHSENSSLDGLGKISDIISKAKSLSQTHIAITDHGVTNGWPIFYKEAKKAEIFPIFGIEGYVCNDMKIAGIDEETKLNITRGLKNNDKKKILKEYETKFELNKRAHIIVLAKNKEGAEEITRLVSDANEYGFYYRPRFDFNRLSELKNVIISSACIGGILGYYIQRNELDKMEAEILRYKQQFCDDFYIELLAIDWDKQTSVNYILAKYAIKHKVKFIITNDCHYVNQEDESTHDCLLAIQSSYKNKSVLINDKDRFRYEMKDLYLKSEDDMRQSFLKRNPKLRNLVEIGLNNTMEIARKCNGEINKGNKIMPTLRIDGINEIIDCNNLKEKEYDYLKSKIIEGWNKKIKDKIDKSLHAVYKERLLEELSLIKKQGFVTYFIIVHRLMKFCEEKGIERGPARGSSAASIVCYLLDITKSTDPIKYNLLFSRFIDPNRTDNPDIDMDFQDDRRHEVMEYFEKEYGKYNVAMLSNNIRFKGKGTLKDVSKAFGVSQQDVNTVAELIIVRSGADSRASFTLEDSFNEFDRCKLFKQKYPEVVKHASKLESIVHFYGRHAAGVVIGDGDLRKYASLRWDKDARTKERIRIINVDKRDIDDLGLLKLDVLGLNILTIMAECKNLVKERQNVDIDLENLEPDDPKVFKEFAKGNCIGNFQFDTLGLIRLSQSIKIANFDELMAATSLHRPGPLHGGQAARYPAKKFKKKITLKTDTEKKETEGTHSFIAEITKDTYEEILYQEQIMMIVRELGGFNWHDTNDIRKCMSKSGGAEYFYRNYWKKFKDGCAKHRIDEKKADQIFKRIMTFGCLSGSTVIKLPWSNQYLPKEITLKQLYENKGIAKVAKDMGNKQFQKNRNAKIFSFSFENNCVKPVRLGKIYKNGNKKTWLMKLKDGKQIRATQEHKFLTKEGWKELKELNCNSVVAVLGDKFSSKKFKGTGSGACDKQHVIKGRQIKWINVISISEPKIEMTYDISMPNPDNNYVANDIIVHNSWAFNKAHACSYGLLSYQTMYLKTYYPIEYLTAYLNKTTDADSVPRIIREAQRLKIRIEEPDINKSSNEFKIVGNSIFCSFNNIKNVGPKALQNIIDNQPYIDLYDFIYKVERRAVNSRVIKSLIAAGCFRYLHKNTKTLMEKFDILYKLALRKGEKYANEFKSMLLDVDKNGEKYTEHEELKIKSEVSPISIGKHIVEFYEPFCQENFGKHIKIVKLNEFILDTNVNAMAQRYNLGKIYPYCLGLLRSIDLKRISQEVKYVIDSEDEFRYAICDFQDETDYTMLSFQSSVYKEYEKKLWDSKGKVVLITGMVIWGAKKIYIKKMWVMDELMQMHKDGSYKEHPEISYIFEHPLDKFPQDKIEFVKKKYSCVDWKLINSLPKDTSKVRIFGIITHNVIAIPIKKVDSKYKGKDILIYEINDSEHGYSFSLYPWQPYYEILVKKLNNYMVNRLPIIITLKFLEMSGSKNKIEEHLRRPSLEIEYNQTVRDTIMVPFNVIKKS